VTTYADFLVSKRATHQPVGLEVAPGALHSRLFPFQRNITRRALQLGRSAIFADTGLGKTLCSLEWARHLPGRVLIICPLAVAWQFVAEAQYLGLRVPYVRNQAEANTDGATICVTNYDMVTHFDPVRWTGVVLDEASSLKNHTGAFRALMMQMWRDTPYKLAQTATPSPNTPTEILEIAEWLGIWETHHALTRWFLRDSNQAGQLRLKGHAASDYYRWLASWCVALTRPSDIGPYNDDGYVLPGLDIHTHTVSIDYARFQRDGQLLPTGRRSATEMWADKRETVQERVQLAAELAASNDLPWVVWVSTDEESRAVMEQLGDDAIEVRGSQHTAEKERRLRGFADNTYRVIVTKPSIASLGLNWQHCHQMVFASVDFSFERRYQALRRCLRFGQQHRVQAHIITTETETNINQAIAEKERQHHDLVRNIVQATRQWGLDPDLATRARLMDYQAQTPLHLPTWLGRVV
jgi:superfamily II DNA or RNA helicase